MSSLEDQTELPPKVTNTGSAPTASQIAVLLNGYQLDIRKVVPRVFQFQLSFVGERTLQVKGQPQVKKHQFERGPRNDESKETRRRLIWGLFQQLLDQNKDVFGVNKNIYTYDCALLLYCINDLGMEKGNKREFVLDVDRNALEDRARSYIKNTERIVAYLLRTETVDLANAVQAYIQGDRSVIQFFELLASQKIFENGQHYCFGNRLYDQESAVRMQGIPHILKSGMQKNVRFVGETKQNAMPILQIDPKKSAFFPGLELLHFVCDLVGYGPDQLTQNMRKIFDLMNKQIKGLVLQTTHLPEHQITFVCAGLTDRPANEITFQRGGQTISVVQHYQQTYHVNLRGSRLPCVIQKVGPKESFYPMELLKIVQGQRVPIEKQMPKITEQMIKQCQVMPSALAEQITIQRDQGKLQNINLFFNAHNVRIDPQLSKTEAALLFPPSIQYNPPSDSVEPNQSAEWKMIGRDIPPNRRYTMPVDWPKTWAVVIIQNVVQMDQCQRFCEQLINTAQRRGIANAMMPQRVDTYTETSIEYVSKKFEFYALHRCMFVLFFAEAKDKAYPGDIHHVMKYCEQKYNVLTQHVGSNTMRKGAIGGGGGAMVIENIIMKTNLKMGGSNYNLITSDNFKRAIRNPRDVFADIWLSGRRMFMGIGMSHAPPQTLFERQSGKAVAIPTVVGMAYSIGREMLRLRGTYWFQQARTTIIRAEQMRPFVDSIKNALLVYESSNNDQFPEHIIVFRGGASEGEFKKVSYWEGNAFLEAFKEISIERSGKFNMPAVTIVVCQRQSNYRIVPERINRQAKASEQNCQPGTVIDKGVMNAALTEFLLIPHKALQGTAQPLRCTVVHEFRPQGSSARIPQMKLEEIEYITYALSYSHGICTMSTAVPGVLYSADELAKRGRNNWKMHTSDGSSAQIFEFPAPGEDQEKAQFELDNKRSVYFADVSDQLNPKIPTKFWA